MERLKSTLEDLDETISELEDKIGLVQGASQENLRKNAELLKQSRAREANVLATAQKIAARLDQTIHHVERILRD